MNTVVSYKYTSPSPAGPFSGKIVWDGKDRVTSGPVPKKGDDVYMMFGAAIVKSVRTASAVN